MSGEKFTPGYKQTEVGKIPSDWLVRRIYEIADNKKSRFDDGDWVEAEHITDKGFRLIQTGNIGVGTFIEKDAKKYIYKTSFYKLNCKEVTAGDLLICRLAEPAGRACILPDLSEEKTITSVDVTIFKPKLEEYDRGYLVQYLSTPKWFSSVGEQVGGTTHKRISRGALGRICIPIPASLNEQNAIAVALSDVDALLTKLDQLIAKKRDIKQAATQQLLTGQTRLPGFSGEWEIKSLGEVALLKNGYMFKSETYSESGKYKVVTIANVQDGFMRMDNCNSVDDLPSDLQPHQLLDVGDLLLSMTGNVGRVCQVTENDCLLNQRVGKIVARCIEFDFLYAALSDRAFQKAMIDVAKGGAQPNLSAQDILGYPIKAPKTQEEQRSIAIILSNMEADLKALEARRRKTQALKEGMMQELLTGKTRIL